MRRTPIFLAVAPLVLAAACSRDATDDAGSFDTTTTPASDGTASEDGAGSDGTEYPQAVQEAFLGACTGQGATEEQCRCMIDQLMETLPFEEYAAFEEELRTDPAAAPPQEVRDALTDCRAG